MNAHLGCSSNGIAKQCERVNQAIHIDHSVRHAAEPGIPVQVLDLVEVQAAGYEPLERRFAAAADEEFDPLRRVRCQFGEDGPQRGIRQEAGGKGFVVLRKAVRSQLFEGMGERIVPDVM